MEKHLLSNNISPRYDFVVCGSGSSGSVVAARAAENPDVSVLLLEAGGTDDAAEVTEPGLWPTNLGSERDWAFAAEPSAHVNGRSIELATGKVLGGGSSINVMAWARGHMSDWDYFAAEAGDRAWSYRSVLDIYRRIEDWDGVRDPDYRGVGGPIYVGPAPDPNPIAPALLEGARLSGIPSYASLNGVMMEREGGASIVELRARDGRRQSVFGSYVRPHLDRPNLTVLTDATVTRVTFSGNVASGIEFTHGGSTHRVGAEYEVVVSLGAINTPKLLMQSGIGDADELRRFGIPVIAHLPGVGQNYQDHVRIDCVWEYIEPVTPRNNGAEAMVFWRSNPALDTPDLQICLAEFPIASAENAADYAMPEHGWSLCAGVLRPESRGRVRLTGPGPADPVAIEANMLADAGDMKAAVAAVELCRDIGNSAALRPFVKREVMPGDLTGKPLEHYIRNAAETYWHHTCTAKMGRDDMSVVDGNLKVYGLERLRIADGSIMPRVTTGNTMAPCVIIGERAGEILKTVYSL
jgi:choline dehydrogenase